MNRDTSVRVCRGFATFLGFAQLTAGPQVHAGYPLVSRGYLADSGSLVHDGRIYSHDSNDHDNSSTTTDRPRPMPLEHAVTSTAWVEGLRMRFFCTGSWAAWCPKIAHAPDYPT
jgi:hypothetical protein